MTDGSTPRLDTYLAAQRLQDTFEGFSADEIERMPMDVYQRLRARAGLPAVDPYSDAYGAYDAPPQADTVPATEAAQANADAVSGLDPNSDAYFHAWRSQRVSGGEGVGIMNSNSGTDAWVTAARSKSGRTQYGQSNVQDAARPDAGKYLRANEPVTGRTSYYK